MASAEHLHKKNRAMLKMSKSELHDFTSTKNLSGPERMAMAREAVGQDMASTQKYQRRGHQNKG